VAYFELACVAKNITCALIHSIFARHEKRVSVTLSLEVLNGYHTYGKL